jgi:hypothetical protein
VERVKTWEMIKMLTENPKLKFKLVGTGIGENTVGITNNKIVWTDISCMPRLVLTFSTLTKNEWKLIQEPVTWQEAIQAWIDGKTIYTIDEDGIETELKGVVEEAYFMKIEFTDSKWYIE